MMMMDASVVSVSLTTVYRVLRQANVIDRHPKTCSTRGKGFEQPLAPHKHWHVDVTYINICGTFYYLCSVLDGFSRAIVHHSLRERMTSADVASIIQKACERHPEARPRIISDNGPQFVAKDFKTFIRFTGMTHVRTSPYYPQSNGKIEAWHKNMKKCTIRSVSPRSYQHACVMINAFVANYNENRLHSALGYITPHAMLRGEQAIIFSRRRAQLAAARKQRKTAAAIRRVQAPPKSSCTVVNGCS
jgi:putative transposase